MNCHLVIFSLKKMNEPNSIKSINYNYLCTRFKNNLCVVGKNLNCAVNQTVGYLQGTRFPPGNFSYYTY